MQWRLLLVAVALGGCTEPPPRRPNPPKTPDSVVSTPVVSPTAVTAPGSGPGGSSASNSIAPGLRSLPGYQASLSKTNPFAGNHESISRGFAMYQKRCAVCHGADLRGVEHHTRHLRDLTQASAYQYGASDPALYRTLRYGIPRTAMGNYEKSMSEEQTWDLVNFLRSRQR